MSNLHLPDYTLTRTVTKTVKPRQRTAKLPSWGIEQRATQGQNQTAPEWNVRWILAPIEANTLDFFLAQQAKTGAWFLWTPPESLQGRFRCDDWTKQLSSCNIWEVQATFRQVFSFTLPRLGASTGYFVLRGTNTGFFRGYNTRHDTGVFALSGNDASLTKMLPIFPDKGVFVLSGSAISTTRSYQLSADTGAFGLTMQPATLTYLSLGGDYYTDWVIQTYGFEADIYPSWWAS
jgi:phage-related protein